MILATNFQGLNLIDMVLPPWWIFDLQCQVGIGSFIVTMIFIVFTLQTMPGQYHYNPFFSLWTQISISSHFYCEVTSLQQVIYSKPNSEKMCFIINWRYLIVNLYCNIEYHTSLTGLMHIFEKTWSDNHKHILDAYILTVAYDCT